MKTSIKNSESFSNSFDLYSLEPNTLISMSFNFDILKYVITELINSQKNTNDELLQLKSEFLEHKKHSNEIESSLKDIRMLSNITPEIKQKLEEEKNNISPKDSETGKEIKYIKTKKNNASKIINTNSNNYLEIEKENNEKEKTEKENNERENIIENKNEIINIIPKNEKEKENIIENEPEKKNIELDNKNIDMNEENEENKEAAKYEKKNVKKDQKNDGIWRQIEILADELKNLKSKNLYLEKDFIEFKNSMNENISKKFDDIMPNVDNKLNAKIENMKKMLNEDIIKNNNEINSLKQVLKKVNTEMSKNIDELSSKENINSIAVAELKTSNNALISKINTISDAFSLYTKVTDFRQYKNQTLERNIADKKEITINLSQIQKNLNTLKGQFYDYINNLTDHNNIEILLKKFEIIQNSIYKLQDFEKEMEEKEKRRIILDPSKYVKNESFNEFVTGARKIFDTNKKEFTEIRVNLEEFKSKEVVTKATLKDLKSLEDKIYKKFENLKLVMTEKFVDKNTLNKNTKILEMQTKQLIEENKKGEKMDNWLLSKRPMGGHLCASCEAYIGDLNQNSTSKFIPWNKYPSKESSEKVFKIGGGISKILQMIKNKNNNNLNNSINNSYNNGPINNINIERYVTSDRNEIDENKNKKSSKTRNNIYSINLNSLSNRNNINQYNKNEEEEDNNLPMISMTMRKNNSAVNIFKAEKKNIGTNTTKNAHNLKNNINYNINSHRKTSQNLIKEDFYLNNEKKIELMDDDNNNLKGPRITKVYKKS